MVCGSFWVRFLLSFFRGLTMCIVLGKNQLSKSPLYVPDSPSLLLLFLVSACTCCLTPRLEKIGKTSSSGLAGRFLCIISDL